jgi:hypothetical protein
MARDSAVALCSTLASVSPPCSHAEPPVHPYFYSTVAHPHAFCSSLALAPPPHRRTFAIVSMQLQAADARLGRRRTLAHYWHRTCDYNDNAIAPQQPQVLVQPSLGKQGSGRASARDVKKKKGFYLCYNSGNCQQYFLQAIHYSFYCLMHAGTAVVVCWQVLHGGVHITTKTHLARYIFTCWAAYSESLVIAQRSVLDSRSRQMVSCPAFAPLSSSNTPV